MEESPLSFSHPDYFIVGNRYTLHSSRLRQIQGKHRKGLWAERLTASHCHLCLCCVTDSMSLNKFLILSRVLLFLVPGNHASVVSWKAALYSIIPLINTNTHTQTHRRYFTDYMMNVMSQFNISEIGRALINDDMLELMKYGTFPLNLTVSPERRQHE